MLQGADHEITLHARQANGRIEITRKDTAVRLAAMSHNDWSVMQQAEVLT